MTATNSSRQLVLFGKENFGQVLFGKTFFIRYFLEKKNYQIFSGNFFLIILTFQANLIQKLRKQINILYNFFIFPSKNNLQVQVQDTSSILHKARPGWGVFFFLKDPDKSYLFPQRESKKRCAQSKNPQIDTCAQQGLNPKTFCSTYRCSIH